MTQWNKRGGVSNSNYSTRKKPALYIELLQDNFDSVRDLDGEDIYVYASSGIEIDSTLWINRFTS